jgi:hypothetical protein
LRVGLVDDVEEELLPLGAGVQALPQAARGAGRGVLEQLAGHVDEVVELLLAVGTRGGLDDLVERDAERLALGGVSDLRKHVHSPNAKTDFVQNQGHYDFGLQVVQSAVLTVLVCYPYDSERIGDY